MVATASVGLLGAGSGGAFAHECTNISKPVSAGIQVLIDVQTDTSVWWSKSVDGRIKAGLIDFSTGEGFSGLIGLDFDGDGKADAATFIVTPNGEIPEQAQWNGATCQGIVNISMVETCAMTTL